MIITTYRYFRRTFGSGAGSKNEQSVTAQATDSASKQTNPPCHHRELGEYSDMVTDVPGQCSQCESDRRARMKYRWKIILGLIPPYCLQSLDITIIASALPWIAADFDQFAQLNWIISAFNLTSAAFIPFWGQMADIFGRHWSLQATLILMLIGSALCTAAPTNAFAVMLLGRAIQGIGCAGIGVIIRIILADKVSLRENARNWAVFTFTGGASYGAGPVIGGYLTAVNWRWCFGINLPVAFVSVLVTYFVIRKETLGPQPIDQLEEQEVGHRLDFTKRLATIDIGGQVLFLIGFGLLILALTWAGASYDWNSAAVLVTLILSVLAVGAFVLYEILMIPGNVLSRRLAHQKPMLPWKVLRNRNISLLFYVNFATGMAMYSVLYFSDLYFTMVKLYDASHAGVQLLFYTPGLATGVYLSVLLCDRFPRQTFAPLFLGSILEAVGIGLLAWVLHSERTAPIYGMIALTGAGTGLRLMPGSLHAIGFFPGHIATVTAVMGVALPFGGTVALTVMATVFNNTSGISRDSPLRNPGGLAKLPPEVLANVTNAAKNGITWAFVAITPFMIICIICAGSLGNVCIDAKGNEQDSAEGRGGKVTHGSYLLALFRGHTDDESHTGGRGSARDWPDDPTGDKSKPGSAPGL